MSVKAGGVGLTLTAASHVFHFDHWWNPATARQAEARAHRIGQQRTVFVYDIFTRDTIEERIYYLLREKQQLFDRIIDDLSEEYVRGAFTDEDLFGLFDLKPPDQQATKSKP
jgi:SNF2 family DNA or RNA helicase